MNQRQRVLLLLTISMLVYANTLWNGFVFDDEMYIFTNQQVIRPTLPGLFSPSKVSNMFRPVTFASLAFNWKIGAGRALGFHLVNLLLHAAVTLLLYLLLCALLDVVPHGATIDGAPQRSPFTAFLINVDVPEYVVFLVRCQDL